MSLPLSTETGHMMILDTNVVSEQARPRPNPVVIQWIADQPRANLFITAVTEAELRYGIALMPAGERRETLEHQNARRRAARNPGASD